MQKGDKEILEFLTVALEKKSEIIVRLAQELEFRVQRYIDLQKENEELKRLCTP